MPLDVDMEMDAWLGAARKYRSSTSSAEFDILEYVGDTAMLGHVLLAEIALAVFATEANMERIFKNAGDVMGADRDATHFATAEMLVSVPYNNQPGRLRVSAREVQRKYDALKANGKLPYHNGS